MTYDEAVQAIRDTRVTVTRDAGPATLRVARRFGRVVALTGGGRFIDYTPTADEYRATDWQITSQDDT